MHDDGSLYGLRLAVLSAVGLEPCHAPLLAHSLARAVVKVFLV